MNIRSSRYTEAFKECRVSGGKQIHKQEILTVQSHNTLTRIQNQSHFILNSTPILELQQEKPVSCLLNLNIYISSINSKKYCFQKIMSLLHFRAS